MSPCTAPDLLALLRSTEGLRKKLLKPFLGRGVDWDDLMSAAVLATLEAIRAHDPARGKFTTIAGAYINGRLKRLLSLSGGPVAVGKNGRERVFRKLTRAGLTPEAAADQARLTGWERVQVLGRLLYADRSLEEPIRTGDPEAPALDFIDPAASPEDQLASKEERDRVHRALSAADLTDQERVIFTRRYLGPLPMGKRVPTKLCVTLPWQQPFR